MYLTIPAALAAGSLFFASPAYATGGVAVPASSEVEAEDSDVEDLEFELTDAEFEAAVEYATQEVNDAAEDPEAFEDAVAEYVDNEVDSDIDNGGAEPMALPVAVIVGARFAGCVAGAYSTLAALDSNSSQAHINMSIANAIVGCVGGGVTAQSIARWISNNPRTVGIALNAIGLGSLSGSEPQASAEVVPNEVPQRFLVA